MIRTPMIYIKIISGILDNNFSKDNSWYLAYSIPDTGESQIRKFSALARYEWQRGNYKQATFYLERLCTILEI